MTTPCDTCFRRALLLAYMACAFSALQYQCHAFASYSSSLTHFPGPNVDVAISPKHRMFGKVTSDEEVRGRPNIVVIKNHEDYVNFLEEDDRLCIIKFYANWCKSCQKFGIKYRRLAYEEGDHIDIAGSMVHMGKVRFAEAEYSASAELCKSLQVRKLPTVHMFRKGEGKIADMTCKPSLFHLVIEEMHQLMDNSGIEESLPCAKPETKIYAGTNGNITSTSFDELGDEIMTSLRKKEEKVGAEKEKKSWFPFTF